MRHTRHRAARKARGELARRCQRAAADVERRLESVKVGGPYPRLVRQRREPVEEGGEARSEDLLLVQALEDAEEALAQPPVDDRFGALPVAADGATPSSEQRGSASSSLQVGASDGVETHASGAERLTGQPRLLLALGRQQRVGLALPPLEQVPFGGAVADEVDAGAGGRARGHLSES